MDGFILSSSIIQRPVPIASRKPEYKLHLRHILTFRKGLQIIAKANEQTKK